MNPTSDGSELPLDHDQLVLVGGGRNSVSNFALTVHQVVADRLGDHFLLSPATVIDLKGKRPTRIHRLLGPRDVARFESSRVRSAPNASSVATERQ
jgi:hypothetical protein